MTVSLEAAVLHLLSNLTLPQSGDATLSFTGLTSFMMGNVCQVGCGNNVGTMLLTLWNDNVRDVGGPVRHDLRAALRAGHIAIGS